MLDNEPTGAAPTGDTPAVASTDSTPTDPTAGQSGTHAAAGAPAPDAAPPERPARRRAARRPAGPPEAVEPASPPEPVNADNAEVEPPAPRKRATRSRRRVAEPDVSEAPAAEDVSAVPAVKDVSAVPAVETEPDVKVDTPSEAAPAARTRTRRRSTAAKAAEDATPPVVAAESAPEEAAEKPRTRTRRRATRAEQPAVPVEAVEAVEAATPVEPEEPAAEAEPTPVEALVVPVEEEAPAATSRRRVRRAPMVTFMAPDPAAAVVERPAPPASPFAVPDPIVETVDEEPEDVEEPDTAAEAEAEDSDAEDENRRRRRRGRRGRGRGRGENGGDGDATDEADTAENDEDDQADADESAESVDGADGDDEAGDDEQGAGTRRRRRRRRRGSAGGDVSETSGADDPPNTVVKVRTPTPAPVRAIEDEVQGVKGSTRLEAKRQRRREGRESNRRRPPVLSEAEFLARREAVNRVMVVRQIGDRTQIAVLEDDVLVEHYVTKASSTAYAGNVYLGRVQNVLPSMEAAFVDIGKGRNAVLYAGEVNWDAAGLEGRPRKIEVALKSGDSVLVQVTKDPIGHKGARLTSQVSLPGRFLVYVPEGQMTGISRKLPDTERKRLKDILKRIVPENAGVIIRTAAEGASEEELTRDVERLEAQWQAIKEKATKGGAPTLLNSEPDLVIRVIRDIFNEDFSELVVSGDEAWQMVDEYIGHVSPDLAERLVHHTAETDVFSVYRIDEQIQKALDRKVWLPSGGSLVIDRTEAMTVVDVNTGKFTGQGGNLEETVTRNNLEAAEEIVRQLRLRDVGGIIVIDFIDMVLEGNRELVLRRLTECLGRDRTKHQVAEVTSLGLVQMTRKRVGQGLLEAFSETCEHCRGRGVVLHTEPLAIKASNGGEPAPAENGAGSGGGREGRRKRKRGSQEPAGVVGAPAVAAVAAIHAASSRTVALAPEDDDIDLDLPDPDPEDAAAPAVAEADAEVESVSAEAWPEVPAPAEPVGVVAVANGATATRRRPRRAASRPAGPPESADG